MSKQASWDSVRAKGEAILANGGVQIVEDTPEQVVAYVMSGVVDGDFPVSDGGPYEVILSKKSWENSRNVGGWVQGFLCECTWGHYHSGQPGRGWSGRFCSHAYAALKACNMRARRDFMRDKAASAISKTAEILMPDIYYEDGAIVLDDEGVMLDDLYIDQNDEETAVGWAIGTLRAYGLDFDEDEVERTVRDIYGDWGGMKSASVSYESVDAHVEQECQRLVNYIEQNDLEPDAYSSDYGQVFDYAVSISDDLEFDDVAVQDEFVDKLIDDALYRIGVGAVESSRRVALAPQHADIMEWIDDIELSDFETTPTRGEDSYELHRGDVDLYIECVSYGMWTPKLSWPNDPNIGLMKSDLDFDNPYDALEELVNMVYDAYGRYGSKKASRHVAYGYGSYDESSRWSCAEEGFEGEYSLDELKSLYESHVDKSEYETFSDWEWDATRSGWLRRIASKTSSEDIGWYHQDNNYGDSSDLFCRDYDDSFWGSITTYSYSDICNWELHEGRNVFVGGSEHDIQSAQESCDAAYADAVADFEQLGDLFILGSKSASDWQLYEENITPELRHDVLDPDEILDMYGAYTDESYRKVENSMLGVVTHHVGMVDDWWSWDTYAGYYSYGIDCGMCHSKEEGMAMCERSFADPGFTVYSSLKNASVWDSFIREHKDQRFDDYNDLAGQFWAWTYDQGFSDGPDGTSDPYSHSSLLDALSIIENVYDPATKMLMASKSSARGKTAEDYYRAKIDGTDYYLEATWNDIKLCSEIYGSDEYSAYEIIQDAYAYSQYELTGKIMRIIGPENDDDDWFYELQESVWNAVGECLEWEQEAYLGWEDDVYASRSASSKFDKDAKIYNYNVWYADGSTDSFRAYYRDEMIKTLATKDDDPDNLRIVDYDITDRYYEPLSDDEFMKIRNDIERERAREHYLASSRTATRKFTYAEMKELEDEIDGRELRNYDRFKDGGLAYRGGF